MSKRSCGSQLVLPGGIVKQITGLACWESLGAATVLRAQHQGKQVPFAG